MHEMSIALDVCRIAEERVGADGMQNVVTIGLEVGDDAGVEFDNLQFCLAALLTQPPFRRARAVYERPRGDALRVTYVEVDDGHSDN